MTLPSLSLRPCIKHTFKIIPDDVVNHATWVHNIPARTNKKGLPEKQMRLEWHCVKRKSNTAVIASDSAAVVVHGCTVNEPKDGISNSHTPPFRDCFVPRNDVVYAHDVVFAYVVLKAVPFGTPCLIGGGGV